MDLILAGGALITRWVVVYSEISREARIAWALKTRIIERIQYNAIYSRRKFEST